MCDTFVAMANHTSGGNLILGKNSDREPNEAQAIVRFPAKVNSENMLRCTYIAVPQVKESYEVILSKPFQMWGAEMGANEHGLAIGNEAVFTKIPFEKHNNGLTGMDLLRLALERCKTAITALELITELLEKYGQNACGGYTDKRFYYHNSFLIADKTEAWVLETAGKEWAAIKVKGFRSISNGLTIEEDFDLHSKNLVDFAHRKKWCKKGEAFNFRKCYSDWFMTKFSYCKMRRALSQKLGDGKPGFSVKDAVEILSSHSNPGQYRPDKAVAADICMHATGLTNPSSTTGSMIVELRQNQPATVWLTGTSNPCLSVFKPFFCGNHILTQGSVAEPSARFDNSLWWQAEKFFRKVNRNYKKNRDLFEQDRTEMQSTFFRKESALINNQSNKNEMEDFSLSCFDIFGLKISEWDRLIVDGSTNYPFNLPYRYFTRKTNKKAGL